MSQAILTVPSRQAAPGRRDYGYCPGLLLLVGTAGLGVGLARLAEIAGFPAGESVLATIAAGLVLGHSGGIPKACRTGVDTYGFWLKLGIILLGANFVLSDVLRLGGVSLACVAVELVLAVGCMTLLGRIFHLPERVTSLLAIGSCICGVTAILAAKDSLDATEEESHSAIAAILTLGISALVAFPLIGHWLNLSGHVFGMWAGLAIDNTAEATAAGALYSETAARFAVLAKTARSSALGFVVLGYAMYWTRRMKAGTVEGKAALVWNKFPKFVLGFVLFSVLATLGVFTPGQTKILATLSYLAFLLAFAALGLRTDFRSLVAQGVRPLAVGVAGELVIATVTLGMVVWASRF